MSRAKFTTKENAWLIHLLNGRIREYEKDFALAKYVCAVENALSSFQYGKGASLKPFEKSLCIGCVNVAMDEIYREINVKTALDLLHIDDIEWENLAKIDMGKDILQKLGYEKRGQHSTDTYSFRYRDCLSAIDKLKQAETICLSHVQYNVYKINFIYKGVEQFPWEMSHSLRLVDLQLHPIKNGEVREFNKRFSLVAGRKQASVLVAGTKGDWYPQHVLTFFNELLN